MFQDFGSKIAKRTKGYAIIGTEHKRLRDDNIQVLEYIKAVFEIFFKLESIGIVNLGWGLERYLDFLSTTTSTIAICSRRYMSLRKIVKNDIPNINENEADNDNQNNA